MKKILLVEDEVTVAHVIQTGLSEENYLVSVAFDGATGMQMALNNVFDLIILDIMLPEKNGLEVCKQLRSQAIQVPILLLTALISSENIVQGLNAGADDYLAKPFKFIELNARVNALIRRSTQIHQPEQGSPLSRQIFSIADLKVDDDAKIVEREGKQITLTATEYRLLLALIKNKGRVLSRIDLLYTVWDINFNLSTNVVDVYINYLRKKIDTAESPKLIHTIVGMGYVLKEL